MKCVFKAFALRLREPVIFLTYTKIRKRIKKAEAVSQQQSKLLRNGKISLETKKSLLSSYTTSVPLYGGKC